QVSNKKPEHVDGQQPTVVGPLVAKITPNSSCRLPDPSDALRHGSIAVKKTCTPSLNNQTLLMAFNMPWNQMRHPLHHRRFLRFLDIITKLAMTLIFYRRRCWQILNIRGFNKVNIGECGLLSS
ncbi:unnamed protein product, partial [Porites lobata]